MEKYVKTGDLSKSIDCSRLIDHFNPQILCNKARVKTLTFFSLSFHSEDVEKKLNVLSTAQISSISLKFESANQINLWK